MPVETGSRFAGRRIAAPREVAEEDSFAGMPNRQPTFQIAVPLFLFHQRVAEKRYPVAVG